jgi:uncharacterized membrane protein YbhN (UPF0104 family)
MWFIYNGITENERKEILESIKNTPIFFIIIMILLAYLACIIRALRWEMLLKPLGYKLYKDVLISSIFIMYLANFVFPRLGEVLRCSILAKHNQVPVEKSIGTMVAERFIDMFAMGIIFLITLGIEFENLKIIYNQYLLKKSSASGGNELYFMLFFGIFGLIVLWKFSPKLRNIIIAKLLGFKDGLLSIKKLENPILFIFYSVLINSIYFFTTYIFFFAVAQTASLPFKSAFLVLISSTLGVALTPNGIGASQYFVSEALNLYNVPIVDGMIYAWGAWIFTAVGLVSGGIFSWIYLTMKSNGQKI